MRSSKFSKWFTYFCSVNEGSKIPEKPFRGPVFVVGMPRSGTKLLRDLLNRHPQISIPVCETHFIPYFFEKYGDDPPFKTNEAFQEFLDELLETNFITDLKEEGIHLNSAAYFQQVDIRSWQSIYEHLFKQLGPKNSNDETIWGDKTPGYLMHLPLLKQMFPEARFIHILRDPRDYCNSVRNTWGKSLYRAAQRWVAAIQQARNEVADFSSDYSEVQYEQLLDSPANVLNNLCGFLNCEYHNVMTTLEKPSENLGDAKGQAQIVSGNKMKFLKTMTASEIRKIEELTFPVLSSLNYQLVHASSAGTLSPVQMKLLKLYDGWKVMWFMMREKGWSTGIRYFINSRKVISWK